MPSLSRMVVLVELFAVFGARDLTAQRVTTAALYGAVRGPDSAGLTSRSCTTRRESQVRV